jgi:DNA-binding NarL/FixJ family response regulator
MPGDRHDHPLDEMALRCPDVTPAAGVARASLTAFVSRPARGEFLKPQEKRVHGPGKSNHGGKNLTIQGKKSEDASALALMTRSSRKRVIVADPRSFVRGCLSCWLDEFGSEFLPVAVGDVADSAENDGLITAAAAILCAPHPAAGRIWLERQVSWLRPRAPALPIVIILDETDPASGQEMVVRLGLQGYIPMSSTLEIAVAALRLVIAGGCYYPNLPSGGSERLGPSGPARDPRLPGTLHLTPREEAVLDLLIKGLPNKIIAHRLGLALSTVKIHVHHIIEKLNVQNRTEVAIWGRNAQALAESQSSEVLPPQPVFETSLRAI